MPRKKILFFSTLNPYPFWAGSENLWYDFLRWPGAEELEVTVCLADSPVTREKARSLEASGTQVNFYAHHNVHFFRRNLYRLGDKLRGRTVRTYPWYDRIKKENHELVFFNVAALADLAELEYATGICRQKKVPYILLLQHGYEDFFPADQAELERTRQVAQGARQFIFISHKNRRSLERALGEELGNAWHTVNAISHEKINKAAALSRTASLHETGQVRFFNLGRFSPRDKAQHLVLEALAAPQWASRDWHLEFIGVSGYGRESLGSLVRFYQLDPGKISIRAHTEDVLEAICNQDILLMPSLSEGTPFAMVEAMACGRPAVGTPVGGIPELIGNNERGWLAANVSQEAVAAALESCWQERDQWIHKGRQAQQFVSDHYDQDSSFPGLLSLIKNSVRT